MSAMIAIGTGRKNVQRHPTSVSSPENTRPAEYPLAPNTAKMPSARLRAGPSANVVVMIDSAAAAVNAADAPLTILVAISNGQSSTSAQGRDTTANTRTDLR